MSVRRFLVKSDPTKRIAELVMLAEFMLVPLLIATYAIAGFALLTLDSLNIYYETDSRIGWLSWLDWTVC